MLYFGFQKLEIYQLSKALVKDIYKLSSSFPSDEKYALVQQINKTTISVASNIAEGTSRNGYKEKYILLIYLIALKWKLIAKQR